MVSPIQLADSSKVYFKGSEDLFSSPGKFSVPEEKAAQESPAEDVVEFSQTNESESKGKSSVGKAILGTISGVILLTASAWGLFKWKGEKWINKEASSTGAKIKNALAKPGEWIDENIVKKISNKFRNKTSEEPDVNSGKPNPETKAPETETPEAKAPETKAPGTETPEVKAPEAKAPGTETPEAKAPETKAPETKAPETKAPETETPEAKAPETKAKEEEKK